MIIKTKYLGPTNYRGSRIKATFYWSDKPDAEVILSYDHALDSIENHTKAAWAAVTRIVNQTRIEYDLSEECRNRLIDRLEKMSLLFQADPGSGFVYIPDDGACVSRDGVTRWNKPVDRVPSHRIS